MSITPEQWSKKLNAYFIAFCRKAFKWSPDYRATLKRAFVEKKEGIEYYRCEACGIVVKRREKQVDHTEPVVSVSSGWDGSWDVLRQRMFVSADCLRVLCKSCHQKKTTAENKERRKNK
jgi:hypothetical protein